MKRLFLVICTLSICFSGFSQKIAVTDSTKISVISCWPPYKGKVAYAKFGHAAMRVRDVLQGIDVIFNWGVFSFDTKNFYLKFVAGKTDYWLGAVPTAQFLASYNGEETWVTDQLLNLTQNETATLIDAINHNYQPENRTYRYNFVNDNCATRPFNLISVALINHNEYIIYDDRFFDGTTYRQLVADAVGENSWLMFGINLIFGAQADTQLGLVDAFFLPIQLYEGLRVASIVSKNGSERDLILQETDLIITNEDLSTINSDFSIPLIVFLLVFLIRSFLMYKELKLKGKKYCLVDTVLLASTGLVGCVAFFLTFCSKHPLVGNNYNLLWLMPLNVVVAALIWFKPLRNILHWYFIGYAVLILGSFVLYALNYQYIDNAAICIALTMLLIAASWIFRTNRTLKHWKKKRQKAQKIRYKLIKQNTSTETTTS